MKKSLKIFGINLNCGPDISIGAFIGLVILGIALGGIISFLVTWGVTALIVFLFALPIVVTWKIACGVWIICIVISQLIRGAINSSKLAQDI